MTSLEQLCANALAGDPQEAAIEYEGQWISWGELQQTAAGVTRLLASGGVGRGDLVALIARNHPAAIATFLALLAAGHSVRMVYPFQSLQAIARDLAAIKPSAVIAASDDLAEPVRSTIHAQDMAAVGLDGMVPVDLGSSGDSRGSSGPAPTPRIEILTSGTTGKPKPFSLDYDTVARHIVGAGVMPEVPGATQTSRPPALLFFPVSNISGLYSTLPPLLGGQQAILLERFSVAGWHDYLCRFRPAVSGLPPAGVQMVLDAELPPEDLACLRYLGTGAAALDPSVQRAFEARYGIPILLSYGATEFAGPVARMSPELHARWGKEKFGSVGQALPGVQLRVIDPESGDPVPAGEQGLLEVISPRIGPAWIRTSDIAVIDEDGFLFHCGRADGAIVRGGFKLLPETIQHALLLHPDISAAAVVDLPDRRLGQVPVAAVELKSGTDQPAPAELEAYLRQQLPATHIPVAWRFVSQLPKTPSFKIDQGAVRRLFDPREEENMGQP